MKVTKAAGIQCIILVLVLVAEIVLAGRYHADYDMGQAADADLQKYTEENAENGLSEEIEYISKLGAPEGIVKPARIVWEEVPAELAETEFIFGGIHVSVPEASTWEYRERTDGAVSVCLSTEEKFLRKLCLTHYRIEW